jgi:hypothetical protein
VEEEDVLAAGTFRRRFELWAQKSSRMSGCFFFALRCAQHEREPGGESPLQAKYYKPIQFTL